MEGRGLNLTAGTSDLLQFQLGFDLCHEIGYAVTESSMSALHLCKPCSVRLTPYLRQHRKVRTYLQARSSLEGFACCGLLLTARYPTSVSWR